MENLEDPRLRTVSRRGVCSDKKPGLLSRGYPDEGGDGFRSERVTYQERRQVALAFIHKLCEALGQIGFVVSRT